MATYDEPIEALIDELARLPGVGPKGAQRIAFYLLNQSSERVNQLVVAISGARDEIGRCGVCFNIAERNPCALCANPARQTGVICVVQEPHDVAAISRVGFGGRFHVLGGALSPLDGIGPDQLRIRELLARIEPEAVTELVLCTNPNVEGDTTALYLARQFQPLGLTITRLARGLPAGGELEHADEITLANAFENRQPVSTATGEKPTC